MSDSNVYRSPNKSERPVTSSGDQPKEKKKKGGKRKATPLIIILVAVVLLGALGVTGYLYFFSSGQGAAKTYTVNDQEQLLYYITNPALKASDTVVVNGTIELDIDTVLAGYISFTPANFDCSSGSLRFVGGTAILKTGDSGKVDMSGVSFSGTNVYIDAPKIDLLIGAGVDTSTANVKTINGSASAGALPENLVGSYIDVALTLKNLSGAALSNVDVEIRCPSIAFGSGNTVTVESIAANGETTVTLSGVVVAGGNERVSATAVGADGALVVFGESEIITTVGPGYYAGDPHTYADDPEYKKTGTLKNNVENAYENGLSFIFSVARDANGAVLPQSTIDSLTGGEGRFVMLPGFEVYNSARSNLVAYNYPSDAEVPYSNWGEVIYGYGTWTRQSAIDMVNEAGGFVIIPHPTSYGSGIQTNIDMMMSSYGVAAMEVLEFSATSDSMEYLVNGNIWNNINSQGYRRMFAIGSSSNDTSNLVGSRFTKGYLGTFDEQNLYNMLQNGNYYASNGPQLSFTAGGVPMGGEVKVVPSGEGESAKTTNIRFTAYDSEPLTSIKIYKYTVTGVIVDLEPELLFDIDLTGQGVYSYTLDEQVAIGADCFIRAEVYSEKAAMYDDIGIALSNPIWFSTASGAGTDTSVAGLGYKVDYLGGVLNPVLFGLSKSEMILSNGGANYVRQFGAITANAVQYSESDGQIVRVKYHKLNSDTMADYITVWVLAADGRTYTTETIYVVPAQ